MEASRLIGSPSLAPVLSLGSFPFLPRMAMQSLVHAEVVSTPPFDLINDMIITQTWQWGPLLHCLRHCGYPWRRCHPRDEHRSSGEPSNHRASPSLLCVAMLVRESNRCNAAPMKTRGTARSTLCSKEDFPPFVTWPTRRLCAHPRARFT
jgi:hypothetical protein